MKLKYAGHLAKEGSKDKWNVITEQSASLEANKQKGRPMTC